MIGGLVLAATGELGSTEQRQFAMPGAEHPLCRALDTMLAAPVSRVLVVAGAGDEEWLAGLDLRGAEAIVCERWEDCRSASLACGLAELTDCEAVVVTLGDQGELPTEAIRRVVAARGGGASAVCATYDGEPGHPVLYEQRLFERLRNVTGDRGARNVLRSARTREIACDDLGGGEDMDGVGLDLLRVRGLPARAGD